MFSNFKLLVVVFKINTGPPSTHTLIDILCTVFPISTNLQPPVYVYVQGHITVEEEENPKKNKFETFTLDADHVYQA